MASAVCARRSSRRAHSSSAAGAAAPCPPVLTTSSNSASAVPCCSVSSRAATRPARSRRSGRPPPPPPPLSPVARRAAASRKAATARSESPWASNDSALPSSGNESSGIRCSKATIVVRSTASRWSPAYGPAARNNRWASLNLPRYRAIHPCSASASTLESRASSVSARSNSPAAIRARPSKDGETPGRERRRRRRRGDARLEHGSRARRLCTVQQELAREPARERRRGPIGEQARDALALRVGRLGQRARRVRQLQRRVRQRRGPFARRPFPVAREPAQLLQLDPERAGAAKRAPT